MSRVTALRGALAVTAGSAVALWRFSRWARQWGALPSEVSAELPGDDIVPHPSTEATRAIAIAAPPEAVWPWLVQMGQDRAGMYSYDWLERWFGLDFHNADRVVPEWQRLAVGDQLRAAPAASGPEAGFTVASIEPMSSIVTIVGDPARVLAAAEAGPLADGATWTFVLRPAGDGSTRLVVRFRARFGLPPPLEWLVGSLLAPAHFIMERKQLLGIKERAERRSVVPIAQ